MMAHFDTRIWALFLALEKIIFTYFAHNWTMKFDYDDKLTISSTFLYHYPVRRLTTRYKKSSKKKDAGTKRSKALLCNTCNVKSGWERTKCHTASVVPALEPALASSLYAVTQLSP